jgi:hypothetical protein
MKTAALLVGINKYPGAPLQGCVPDITSVHAYLNKNHGITDKNSLVLLDKQATSAQIRRGLQWLAAQGADVAYFFYSGHGSRVRDVDGDEARQGNTSGFDQCIVPVDYGSKGFIIDDDLGALYSTFPANTKIVVHLDSCFSAKSDRGVLSFAYDAFDKHVRDRRARSLPRDYVTDPILKATRYNRDRTRATLPKRRILLFSGCRDFETSADAYIDGVGYRGAMTYYVEQAMATLQKKFPNPTYRQVWEMTKQMLKAEDYSQIPQLDGPPEWLNQPIYT